MNLFAYSLSGILYVLSFSNFNLSWLAWVSLVPFIMAVDREKELQACLRGSFLCGWIMFLGGMYWLTEVTWLGYILLTFYMAWYVVLFGIVRFYNKSFIVIPLAWTALEFIRGNLGGGIPWLLLGASQYKFPLLIQMANITGVYGVSFIVAMVNAKIAPAAKLCFAKRRGWQGWVLVLCILGAVIVYGRHELEKPVTGSKVRIGLVQPNIPLEIKWDPQYTNWMVDRLVDLSEKAGPVDILIWPETAVPELTESPGIRKQLGLVAGELGCVLVVGSQGIDSKRNYYNSAFLVSMEGELSAEYRKIHLVPFGEYIPLEKWFPFLRGFTPIQGGFCAGRDHTVFNVGGVGLGVLICFEDIFPALARRFVLKGANILVNITNDAWFGKTAGPYQHAALSVFRAVENRVPLVRATNTGVSCFVNPAGEIVEVVRGPSGGELFVEGYAVREVVAANRGRTFYSRYGDIFSWGCIVVLIGMLAAHLVPIGSKWVRGGKDVG